MRSMKKYLSVLELAAASTWSKILGILLALTVCDFCWFGFRIFKEYPDAAEYEAGIYQINLMDILSGPVFPILFALAAMALFLILNGILNHKNVNPSYTIRRLGIRERDFFLTLIGFYFMTYLLLFLVQILLILAIGIIFGFLAGQGNMGSQDLLLVFIMDDFAARLLPVGYPAGFICEILFILAFAATGVDSDRISAMDKKAVRGKVSYLAALTCFFCMYYMLGGFDALLMFIAIIAFVCLIYHIYNICRLSDKDEAEDERQEEDD